MTGPEFAAFAADVEYRADNIVANDERGGDAEVAHADQDQLAHDVLDWIAEHSTDEQARLLAAQACRPFRTDGVRWFA